MRRVFESLKSCFLLTNDQKPDDAITEIITVAEIWMMSVIGTPGGTCLLQSKNVKLSGDPWLQSFRYITNQFRIRDPAIAKRYNTMCYMVLYLSVRQPTTQYLISLTAKIFSIADIAAYAIILLNGVLVIIAPFIVLLLIIWVVKHARRNYSSSPDQEEWLN